MFVVAYLRDTFFCTLRGIDRIELRPNFEYEIEIYTL